MWIYCLEDLLCGGPPLACEYFVDTFFLVYSVWGWLWYCFGFMMVDSAPSC